MYLLEKGLEFYAKNFLNLHGWIKTIPQAENLFGAKFQKHHKHAIIMLARKEVPDSVNVFRLHLSALIYASAIKKVDVIINMKDLL